MLNQKSPNHPYSNHSFSFPTELSSSQTTKYDFSQNLELGKTQLHHNYAFGET